MLCAHRLSGPSRAGIITEAASVLNSDGGVTGWRLHGDPGRSLASELTVLSAERQVGLLPRPLRMFWGTPLGDDAWRRLRLARRGRCG